MSYEILGGLTEILGDDYDVVGAAKQMARRPAGAPGVAYTQKEATRGRELVMGFDSGAGTIAAAGTANVNSNPQQVFRPERITIPATIAPHFLLNSLTIGTAIQFLNATGVHAETFGSTAQDVRLRMDTAQINSVVSFNVTNLSGAVVRYFASLIGSSVL